MLALAGALSGAATGGAPAKPASAVNGPRSDRTLSADQPSALLLAQMTQEQLKTNHGAFENVRLLIPTVTCYASGIGQIIDS